MYQPDTKLIVDSASLQPCESVSAFVMHGFPSLKYCDCHSAHSVSSTMSAADGRCSTAAENIAPAERS